MQERSDKAPIEYIEMCYRREFCITPAQMDEIPTHIIERDLFFMSREAKIRKLKEQ